MKLMKTLLAATALVALMAGGAAAKQLVYCSEGSPEGFDPSLWSAGTTFDASARAVYSRLVDFELGGTDDRARRSPRPGTSPRTAPRSPSTSVRT